MTLSKKAFRNVMGCFATGVTIVTTKYHREYFGLTVNSFTSVSLEPLLILINIEKRAFTHDKIILAKNFTVNILTEKQKELSRRFSRRSEINRFRGVDTFESKSGAPIITNAFAYLDAKVVKTYDGGDHTIIIGEVIDLGILDPSAKPLLFYRGEYRRIAGD